MWSLYSWASLMQLRNEVLKIQVWTELQLRSTRPTGRRSVSIGPSISTYRALHWHPKGQWPVSRKSRKLFGPEKPFLKLRLAHSVKLVFSYVVKGRKIKSNCKVSCPETPSFWKYKENYVTRNAPEKFRDFRETGPRIQIPFRSKFLRPSFHYCDDHVTIPGFTH